MLSTSFVEVLIWAQLSLLRCWTQRGHLRRNNKSTRCTFRFLRSISSLSSQYISITAVSTFNLFIYTSVRLQQFLFMHELCFICYSTHFPPKTFETLLITCPDLFRPTLTDVSTRAFWVRVRFLCKESVTNRRFWFQLLVYDSFSNSHFFIPLASITTKNRWHPGCTLLTHVTWSAEVEA